MTVYIYRASAAAHEEDWATYTAGQRRATERYYEDRDTIDHRYDPRGNPSGQRRPRQKRSKSNG